MGRLTDLPGVCAGLPRSAVGALEAIRRYEEQNDDLEPRLRRLMALSAVGKRFGRVVLESALGQKLPKLPFRDWSWRWWNALESAGLGKHWPLFLDGVVYGGVREGARRLRQKVSVKKYRRFLRRAGTNPHNHHSAVRDVVWTKGGCWRVESYLTQLLVLKRHLPTRPRILRWQKKLTDNDVLKLERELMAVINPDALMSFEAKANAVDYVRRRLPELLKWKWPRMSMTAAAWFLMAPVPQAGGGGRLALNRKTGYVDRNRERLPILRDIWSW